MSKYEKSFNTILNMLNEKGIWFKNDAVKIGFSYAEICFDDTDGAITLYADCETAIDECIYESFEKLFEHFPKLEFNFCLESSLNGNFATWSEFKDIVDGKSNKTLLVL